MDKESIKPKGGGGGGEESSSHASNSNSTSRPGACQVENTVSPSSTLKPAVARSPRKSRGSASTNASPVKDIASPAGSMTFRQQRLTQTASDLSDGDEDSKSSSSSSSHDPRPTTPGAVHHQSVANDGTDEKSHSVPPSYTIPPPPITGAGEEDVEEAVTLTASVVDENAPTAQDIQELKRQISLLTKQNSTATDTPMNANIVVAEKVEKDDDEGQHGVGEDDGKFWSSCSKTKVLLVLLVVVVIAVGAGVGAAVATSGSSSSSEDGAEDNNADGAVVEPPVSFDLVAPSIDGREPDLNFGSSMALSTDGNRMIVADEVAVTIYDLVDGYWNQVGEPIIPDDCGEKQSLGVIDASIRSTIVVDLSGEGGMLNFDDSASAYKVYRFIKPHRNLSFYVFHYKFRHLCGRMPVCHWFQRHSVGW